MEDKKGECLPVCKKVFLAVQDSSIGDLVSKTSFDFRPETRDSRLEATTMTIIYNNYNE